jgi:hypothetical protein
MGPGVVRLEGWESRLNDVIESARHTPYKLGTHDCFRVACMAVEALTGIDHWPKWEGRYSNRREALILIHQYGGGFTPAASKLFGCEPVSMRFARRGDIAEYADAEQHLGVCLGERVAVLGAEGLHYAPLLVCRHAWRIG